MAEIPQFPTERFANRGVDIERDPAHVDPNMLAAPGVAMERAAQGTEAFAQHLGQLAQTSATNYYNDNLADAETKAHESLQNGIDEAQKTGDYQGFAAKQSQALDADLQSRLEGAPGMVASRLKSRFAVLQDQIASRASAFEHGMATSDAQAKQIQGIDDAAKTAYRDPSMAIDSWSRINASLNTPGAYNFPADKRAELTRAAGNAIFGAALIGRAQTDPEGALADFNAGKYDPYLDAKTIEGLRPQLQGALARGFVNRLTNSGAIDQAASAGGGVPSAGGVPPAPDVPGQYQPLIAQAASDNGVPPELLTRVLSAESGFDPTARSSKGAQGIAQFLPSTARDRGLANPDDPTQAIPAAAQYLAELHQQHGSWLGALSGYLGGDPQQAASYMKEGATQLAQQLDSGAPASGATPGAAPTGAPAAGGGLAHLYGQVDALNLAPDLALRVKSEVRTQYDAALTDQARAVRMQQLARTQASDAQENAIIANARSDKPTVTARQAANDPALTPAAKLRMVQFLAHNGEVDPGVSHQTAIALMKGIGDGTVTTQAPIIDAFGQGKLGWTDFDQLGKQLAEAGGDPGFAKRKAMFFKAIEPQIDKSGFTGMPDQQGKERFYEFMTAFDQKAAAYRASGKDPGDLLDPSKPEYQGKPEAVKPYIGPLARKLQDALAGAAGTPGAGGGPPAAAIGYLQAHPELRGAFDQKYGAGAAEKALAGPAALAPPMR